ncbi:MAG: hypothetical protein GEU75_09750 [Dehalococcoidia bacterium]|nr:hypothetical protein [Dehalococcoidia bacterium]
MTPGPNLKLGSILFLFAFVIGVIGLYGGSTLVDRPNPVTAVDEGDVEVPTGPVSVTLVAKDLKFNLRSIVAGTGVPVTVTLDNQDPGTLHNVAFYTSRAATQTIHKGELIAGPATRTENFTAPSTAGSYFFHCDAHPDTMTGSFIVR